MTSLLMSSTLSAPAELSSSADCDDITADVIIADSRSCTSCQLLIVMTSFLLLIASSRIYADVITADSRFLFASIQQLISFLHTSARLQLFIFFFEISPADFTVPVPAGIFSLALAAGSYRSSWFTMLQLVQLGLRLITNN
ncbi:TMV resistance protein N-like [Dorcoceras hygrometricum]|uniref:TMV resistance protein N-like n=1 Tax=Dorcoceras hygrometricum TaxID=472368 RepID=A0A2Z7CG62_9LAMI|nr:TMV resistance protein N-like [Dorcoceras hygrometricum]